MGDVIRLNKKDDPVKLLEVLRSLPDRIEAGEVDTVALGYLEVGNGYREPQTVLWGTTEDNSFMVGMLHSWHWIDYYIQSQGIEVEDE